MLFPPPGMKLHRSLKWWSIPTVPVLVCGLEPNRVLVEMWMGQNTNLYFTVGGSAADTPASEYPYGGYYEPMRLYGPDEVWARTAPVGAGNPAQVLVQSVYLVPVTAL